MVTYKMRRVVVAVIFFAGFALAQIDEGENPLPGSPAVTTVMTSQCDAEDRCICVVTPPEPCPADVVYSELQLARGQLNDVLYLLKGDVLAALHSDLRELINRMNILESSLHNQSISLSMTELSGLQDQVTAIQATLAEISASRNGTVTDYLQGEIDAIQASLLALGTKNPIAVQEDLNKEIDRLRSRLSSCSTIASNHGEENLDFIGDGLPANQTIDPGVCPAYRNLTVGAPVTYKFRSGVTGMWLKDPLPTSDEEKTKIYEMPYQAARSQKLKSWANLDDYERTDFDSRAIQAGCAVHSYGQKMLYLNGFLYWYDLNDYRLKKMDVFGDSTCATTYVKSTYTLGNIHSDYLGSSYNDGDLNFDETGLYVVFADSNADLSIIKLNPVTLAEEQRWDTGKQKKSVANVFMICGRLYTTDDYRSRHLTGKQWGYDTNTGEEFFYELDVESKYGNLQALSYSPREKAIFGWDNSHPVLYPVFF